MFGFFERLIPIYPAELPADPPQRFLPFLWACAQGARPYLLLITVFTAIIGSFEAVLFGMMAVCIRLASKQLHPFEIAFFRNLFGFVFTLPLLVRHGWGLLHTNKLPLYLMRSAIGIVGMLAGFWAIVHLPLAQAVALS